MSDRRGGDWMEKPSKIRNLSLVILGFLLSLSEPIILLALGRDLPSALWPMANRSLELTYFLRTWHIEIFAISLLSLPFIFLRSSKPSKFEYYLAWISMGLCIGLTLLFVLLDYAFLRGAFVLLPTCLGIILLCSYFIAFEMRKYKLNYLKLDVKNLPNVFVVFLAVWLISPGITSMAGLLPSPPELYLADGQYGVTTNVYQYPMPEEVARIQGDYEEDVVFSVYLSTPEDVTHQIPLAIVLHGFASPFFDSYKDWVMELSSRGMAVAFIQYPSDVMPEGHDNYTLEEKDGMSNHPFHVPRIIAIEAALEQLNNSLPENVNKDHILVGGHSLGAGYALVVLDRILSKGWGQETVFVSLESSYARPVQEDLQIGAMNLPEEFLAHVVVSEDDLSVNDCFGVHHHELLGHGSLFIEIPSDKYGFPRLVATHYIQATETHDTHADWGFYRRVAYQAEWLVERTLGDIENALLAKSKLIDSDSFRFMGEWSDGRAVEPLRTYADPLSSPKYDHCSNWVGP